MDGADRQEVCFARAPARAVIIMIMNAELYRSVSHVLIVMDCAALKVLFL